METTSKEEEEQRRKPKPEQEQEGMPQHKHCVDSCIPMQQSLCTL
jgi:hypothetical protein